MDPDRVTIAPPPNSKQADRQTTLAEDEFFGGLDAKRPGTSTRLREFLSAQEDLNVQYEVLKTLVVRMTVGDLRVIPFVVNLEGAVDTGYSFYALAPEYRKPVMRVYAEKLASAIPGASVKETPATWYVPRRKSDGKSLTVWDILEHQGSCRVALETLHQAMLDAVA